MQSLTIVILSIITLFTLTEARIAWMCDPCLSEHECNLKPEEGCLWGEARDDCNRRVCAKGPGKLCGGPDRMFGTCGDGMMCRNERCYGCSELTFKCFP